MKRVPTKIIPARIIQRYAAGESIKNAEFVWKTFLKAGPVRVKRHDGRWQIIGDGALIGEGKTLFEAWRNAAVNLQT